MPGRRGDRDAAGRHRDRAVARLVPRGDDWELALADLERTLIDIERGWRDELAAWRDEHVSRMRDQVRGEIERAVDEVVAELARQQGPGSR
jgi:hypothetical protein